MVDEEVPSADGGDVKEEDKEFDEDAPDLDDEFEGHDDEPDKGDHDEDGDDDDGDDDDGDDVPAPKPAGSDDDDDDDVDPSDVEADLDEILRERIAANDDDDEDEGPIQDARKKASVAPKRSDEWTCNQCFLIVSSSQFGTRDDPRCPSGEDPCVSLKRALG